MLILPAIDLRGGHCVRLTQGDYTQERIYDSDPIRVAQEFQDQGALWVHVVDLDGAKEGIPKNWDAIEGIAQKLSIPIEVGGGVRSMETANRLLQAGVRRVVVGTKLVQDPQLAEQMFGELGDRVVAGIDARDGKAAVAGWIEQATIGAVELAQKMERLGAKRIILTDIAQDGMLSGPNMDLLYAVASQVSIPVIHSGGIGVLADLNRLRQAPICPEGVIVGRAIYEGRFSVRDAVTFLESPSI